MALMIKNVNLPRAAGATGAGVAVLNQWIHVAMATRTLPQASTDVIFKVYTGRVLVHLLYGEVTTVIEAADPVMKVSCQKLDAGLAATVGTAVDVATTVDLTSLEVGGNLTVLGSGGALVKNNAGAGLATLGRNDWVAPRGQIYLTTTASRTGSIKWDLFYQPLDEGAYVAATTAAATKV